MRHVTGSTVLGEGKWLRLLELHYRDDRKEPQRLLKWESVERTTRALGSTVDGVDIIATVGDKLIVVAQYRPPLDAICLELPAGLITEPNESPITAAIRELKEETGYVAGETEATVIGTGPLSLDPGVSGCNMRYVRLLVDPADPSNQNPQPALQDEEEIETVLLRLDGNLLEALNQLCLERDFVMDARLASVAVGLSLAS